MRKKTKVNIKLFCILLVAVILISSVIGSLNNIAKADINDNEQYIDIYNNDLVFTPIDSVDYENSYIEPAETKNIYNTASIEPRWG